MTTSVAIPGSLLDDVRRARAAVDLRLLRSFGLACSIGSGAGIVVALAVALNRSLNTAAIVICAAGLLCGALVLAFTRGGSTQAATITASVGVAVIGFGLQVLTPYGLAIAMLAIMLCLIIFAELLGPIGLGVYVFFVAVGHCAAVPLRELTYPEFFTPRIYGMMAINTVIIVLGYSVTRIRTKLRAKEIESLESRLEELELVLATQRDVTEGRLDVDRLSGDRDSHAVTRTMVDTLRSLIEHVDGAATRVNLVAGEIEHRSGRQRREAGALAQGVEETLATLVEHSERTQVMVSTARQSEQSADQVREEIEASNAQLHGLRTKLDSVQEQVLAIRGLAAKAEVLALNASLEASRAGEEGKGFRLVATRMRGFSQAVSEASSTVRAVLEEMVGAVLVARDATTRAEAGAAQNNERGRRVADECQVQAESIASLQQVVRGMAELAQKHGDAAEEAAREVGDLREAATHLAGGVTQFLAGRRKSSSPSTASEALPARSVDKPPGQ